MSETNPTPAPAPLTLAEKAKRELFRYLAISAYLFICLGALILYKASILRAEGVAFGSIGMALAKALILGKFILLAETFRFGERAQAGRVAVDIVIKALLFAVLLLILSLLEEGIVGWFRGRTMLEIVQSFAGGTLPQVLATVFLMVLILIPYFAFSEISACMGPGELKGLLTRRKPRETG